ncbi:MAG: MT-A70 family methyltransferase [bacterium]
MWSARGKGKSAEQHYECMSLFDIQSLPLPQCCADDCVLFLWTTDPFLEKALDTIKAWGFTYKTVGFYWVKTERTGKWSVGCGSWTRANPELCLLATKGKPKRKSKSVQRLIVSPRREHSRKPDEVRERIVELVDGPYLELFSRTTHPQWDVWGKEAGKWTQGTSSLFGSSP